MRRRDAFAELLTDLLAPLGDIVIKPMFSGSGVYADGQFFALVFDGKLYLKSDASTAARFDAEGLAPFSYTTKSKTVAMSYRQVPERCYDDPDEMLDWARAALSVAAKVTAAKPKKRAKAGVTPMPRPSVKRDPKGRSRAGK